MTTAKLSETLSFAVSLLYTTFERFLSNFDIFPSCGDKTVQQIPSNCIHLTIFRCVGLMYLRGLLIVANHLDLTYTLCNIRVFLI